MSSDSSDEENLDLLKEAQDTQFINDSMFSDSPESRAKFLEDQNKKVLPSLRRNKDDEAQFNFLKVTPEFRSHVAKKLSAILDRKLDKNFADLEVRAPPKKKQKKAGVKLLSNSTHFLKTNTRSTATTDLELIHNQKAKFFRNNNKVNSEVSEELLKQVAVSPEDILSGKEVKNWSGRSKAPVFRYKKSQNGQLELIEPEFK